MQTIISILTIALATLSLFSCQSAGKEAEIDSQTEVETPKKKTQDLAEVIQNVQAIEGETTMESLNEMTKNWKVDDERSAIYAHIKKTKMEGVLSVNSRTRLKVKVFDKGDYRKLVITEEARSGDRWDLEMRFESGENKPGTYDIISEGSYFYYTKSVDGETYTSSSKSTVPPTGKIVFTELNEKSIKGTLTFGVAKMEETKSKAGGINNHIPVGVDMSFFNPNVNSK